MRNTIRSLSIVLSAVGALSCSETIQSTSPIARRAVLSLAPQFDPAARRTAALLAQVGIAFDHVRIIIIRLPADTLRDTTFAFQPGDTAQTLELAVLATPSDTLQATIQYVSGTSVLFQGTAQVVAVPVNAAATATNTDSITVKYTGPGATATKVVVSPGTGTYGSGTSTQFTATASDASNAQVPNPPIVWSVSDTSVATISAVAGLLTPKVLRGTVTVTATVGTASGSVTATLAPATTRLRVVQGAAQIAPPGATLPLPVIIEAVAADGLPAAGAGLTATFVANTTGASVTPASVPLDANGRAQATLTLGTNAGGIYLYTAAVGAFSITFSEIAVVGPPAQIIPNGSTTITMTAGVAPTPLPTFRVADALGNSVPGVLLQATITLASPLTVQTTPVFVADTIGLGDLSAIAAKLTIAGSYTVTIGSPTTPAPFPALTYNITVQPAAAASLAFVKGPSTVVANAVMSPAVTVTILDSFGNVTTSTVTVTIAVDPATGTGVSGTAGTLTASAVNGTATFSNLRFSPTGKTGVRLIASALGFSVLSGTFNIQ